MDYPANYANGRCPECGRPMTYIADSSGHQPGTWLHDKTADRDACQSGDGRY
jgi:hypothetical protein